MNTIIVRSHEELLNSYDGSGGYRCYRFAVSANGHNFFVITEGGENEYEGLSEEFSGIVSSDEELSEGIAVAIGEYMEAMGIDPGKVSR